MFLLLHLRLLLLTHAMYAEGGTHGSHDGEIHCFPRPTVRGPQGEGLFLTGKKGKTEGTKETVQPETAVFSTLVSFDYDFLQP